MKICVVGSPAIDDVAYVTRKLDKFVQEHVTTGKPVFMAGGGKGTDAIVKKFAYDRGYDFIEFIPYNLLDKSVEFSNRYYFTRNRQMIMNADRVLAFYDGNFTGTIHAIKYSQKIGVPVMVHKMIPEVEQ